MGITVANKIVEAAVKAPQVFVGASLARVMSTLETPVFN